MQKVHEGFRFFSKSAKNERLCFEEGTMECCIFFLLKVENLKHIFERGFLVLNGKFSLNVWYLVVIALQF